VLGLRFREVRFDVQLVASGQMRRLGDRQRHVTSRDGDFERGALQIEGRGTGGMRTGN
jgi:hypothetical protein